MSQRAVWAQLAAILSLAAVGCSGSGGGRGVTDAGGANDDGPTVERDAAIRDSSQQRDSSPLDAFTTADVLPHTDTSGTPDAIPTVNAYYVKTGGNDSASGLSDAAAWATVAKVNDYAESPGFPDGSVIHFHRGDTFTDETLGHDGSAIDWGTVNGLTFQAYGTGNRPKLGQGINQAVFIHGRAGPGQLSNLVIKDLDVSGDAAALILNGNLVEIYRVDGATVDGIFGDGHLGGTILRAGQGLALTRCTGALEVKNSEIFNQGPADMPTLTGDYHNLQVRNPDGGPYPTSLEIHDNTFHHANADNIQVGNYQGAAVAHIYNNHLYAFGENALDLKSDSYVDVYNNVMDRMGWGQGGTGGGDGTLAFTNSHGSSFPNSPPPNHYNIYNNHFINARYWHIRYLYCDNCTIHGNYFEGNAVGGIRISNGDTGSIRDNVFEMTEGNDCVASDCSGIRIDNSAAKANITIEKNTFYLNSTKHLYAIAYQRHSGSTGFDIRNNVFHLMRSSSSVFPVYVDTGAGANPTLLDNIYVNTHHTNRASIAGTEYDSAEQDAFRAAVDSRALFGTTPVYNDAANHDYSLDYPGTGLDGSVLFGATQGAFYVPSR